MKNESTKPVPVPDMLLELVLLPVSDVDRAKAFYVEKVGFNLDVDVQPNDKVRIVQMTPPGSACSITVSTGLSEISEQPPGAVKGLHLVVKDIQVSRQALIDRGVEVGEIDDQGQGVKYAYFRDPDGNSWLLQEMSWRTWS